jgi:murein DD-endopeptidase MepM/ murein hydrolase activator NlpD
VQSRQALLTALVLAVAVPSSPAWATGGGGGAPAPTAPAPAASGVSGGGTAPGQAVKKPPRKAAPRKHARRKPARGPLLTSFSLTRSRLFLYGRPARVSFRITGRGPVRVRLRLVPEAKGAVVRSVALGDQSTGVTHTVALTGREDGVLAQGSYTLRIAGADSRGRGLRRAPQASSHAELRFFLHRFPVAGAFTYGDGFGVARSGHSHQGQDLPAASGTPVVAPRGGVVTTVQYQAGGAGNYVVLDAEGEDYDYVFMHLKTGSTVVKVGQHVRTGQRLGDVGATGDATGPHLHFEIWQGAWYGGGHPIDPLPLLRKFG